MLEFDKFVEISDDIEDKIYSINLRGEVIDVDGVFIIPEQITIKSLKHHDPKVTLSSFTDETKIPSLLINIQGTYTYRAISTLVLNTFSPVPVEVESDILIEYISPDPTITAYFDLCRIYTSSKYTPQPYEVDDTYKYIPTYDRYVISEEGNVIDTANPTVRIRIGTLKGYKQAILTDQDTNLTQMPALHRLVALAWVPIPIVPDTTYLIINHRDGDRANLKPWNLEWTTYSCNTIHAVNTGLSKQPNAIIIKDHYLNIEKINPSTSSTAHVMGMVHATLTNYLNNNEHYLHLNRYQFKRAGDTTPWKDPYVKSWKVSGSGPIPVKSYEIATGIVRVHDSQGAAARDLNIDVNAIRTRLKRDFEKNRPHGGYLFKHQGDESEWIADGPLKHDPKPVRIVNLNTGEESVYSTTQQAVDATMIDRNAIRRRLSGESKWPYKKDGVKYQISAA